MAKKKQQKQQPMSPERYIREKARKLPIYKCYIGDNAGNSREKLAIIIRQHTCGTFTYACFLLDCWCIGVKDAFWDFSVSENELDRIINHYERGMDLREVDYVEAHNWIYGAVDWATNAGINPCKEFSLAKYILEEDDDNVELIEYDFGYNGEYVLEAKSQQEANKYISALNRTLGKDNYKVIISPLFGEDDDYYDEEEDRKEDMYNRLIDAMDKLREEVKNDKPLMDYTYKGIDYPHTILLNHPDIQPIIEKDIDNITDDDLDFVLSKPADTLRHDLHSLMMFEIGKQWGATKDDYQTRDDFHWEIFGTAMMFLIHVGTKEETLPVFLEIMRQSNAFFDFNFGDIPDWFIEPLVWKLCKDDPRSVMPYLLEEGLCTWCKIQVVTALEVIGSYNKKVLPVISDMLTELLTAYKEDLPQRHITDGSVTAFTMTVPVNLGMKDFLPQIEDIYATGLVDESVMGDIKEVRKEFKQPYSRAELPASTAYEFIASYRSAFGNRKK